MPESSGPVETLETILRDGFILVFNSEELDPVLTARALLAAGMTNMEVTCRVRGAADKLRRLKAELPGFKAGAASLVDFDRRPAFVPSAAEMAGAGADFLVSAAAFRPETYRDFAGRLPLIPGCGSVTEILAQHALGASLCKLFPAAQLGGPRFLEAVDPAIHRTVSVMPTGGTTLENIPDYVAAGALVVGGSFSMFAKDAVRSAAGGDFGPLAEELRRAKSVVDAARARKYPGLDWARASLSEIEAATGRRFNLPLPAAPRARP